MEPKMQRAVTFDMEYVPPTVHNTINVESNYNFNKERMTPKMDSSRKESINRAETLLS